MAKPFLSVIIPVHNGSENLPLTLIDVDKHLAQEEYSYEILVVDDGSNDNTVDVVRKLSGLIKNLKLVDNPVEEGFGAAIRLGMMTAKGNWRVFMDIDNVTPITEFNKMMPHFREGFDVFVGSNGKDFMCFSEISSQQIFGLNKTAKWAFGYEFTALAKMLDLRVKYMTPIYQRRWWLIWRKPLTIFRWLWEFIKIRWRLWRKLYKPSQLW
ncbi:MAG: glycosyltransferase family 2 protein [bacterium]|nr:glycosyltransferase family 2 protein [bacterium]